jgi:hypothetical protein
MMNISSAVSYNPGRLAAMVTKFALIAGASNAYALPPKNVDMMFMAPEARDVALANWIHSNPSQKDGLLEALMVADIEGVSSNDTRPIDAARVASRFSSDSLASYAFVEQASNLIQQFNSLQPLAYSAETRALASQAIASQAARRDEDIEKWAAELVASMRKQA